jgi:thioesterase domain-containing protein/NRPS condensation-like uncharacterized protein
MTPNPGTCIDVSSDMLDLAASSPQSATQADDVYVMPATQGQLRFWSLDQLKPGNPGLNMPLMWRCRGELNVELLAKAFTQAINRHEILRTTFAVFDGKLSQVIAGAYAVPLPFIDLQHLCDAENSPEARQLIQQHAAIPMDLHGGPLLLLKLLKYGPHDHLLLLTMHHIICDGISLGILLRDIAVLYKALVHNTIANLPELPIQFADFAVWQEDWRKSEDAEKSLHFWRTSLGADLPQLQTRRDPPLTSAEQKDTDSVEGDIETFLISPELTQAAHQFCIRENVTLNILLFSIFCAMLYRITGQQDLVIGSPCANRTEETEELVGLFMNIQVLRLRIKPQETFRSLLDQVQNWTLAAYENQTLPFEDLLYDPYFSEAGADFEIPIFFLYQKSFMLTQQVAGLEITPLRSMSPGAVFEMMFAIVDRPEEGPRLQLEYNPRHYRKATIRGYLKLFVNQLEAALESPNHPITTEEPGQNIVDFQQPLQSQTALSPAQIQPIRNAQSPPTDPIQIQLLALWKTTLGIEDLDIDTNVFDVGATSLTILRVVTRINRLHAMNFTLASVMAAPTIRMIAKLVRSGYAPNTKTSLIPIQPLGTKPALFVVHGAHGHVVNFYGLRSRIDSDQPVYGVQAQALEVGHSALLRLEDMASYYLQEIRRIQPTGPYHLLGYSFGGVLVLEMAHQLRASGQNVGLIGMVDTVVGEYLAKDLRSEKTGAKKPPRTLANYVLSQFKRGGPKAWFHYVHRAIRLHAIRYMTRAAAKFAKTIPEFLKHTHDINAVASSNYRLKPTAGKLTLFRAIKQFDDTIPFDNGWSLFFEDGVDIHELPGHHFNILAEPGMDLLGKKLRILLRDP